MKQRGARRIDLVSRLSIAMRRTRLDMRKMPCFQRNPQIFHVGMDSAFSITREARCIQPGLQDS
jgi:hypothetical protein